MKLIRRIKSLIFKVLEFLKAIFLFIPKFILQKSGYIVLKKSYYLPIPDEKELQFAFDSEMVGMEINDNGIFNFLNEVILKYKNEFNSFSHFPVSDPSEYYLINGNYMAIDSNVYYSLIRQIKPKKIIEIGSGNSSLLACAAIKKNILESGQKSELTCIEPFPHPKIKNYHKDIIQLIEKPVQEVQLEIFNLLEANDILFIDSTHVLKTGGDVWYEYCEILPRIKSGVYIHIHDISLPKPYPSVYFKENLFWNEQYILQALLTNNNRFEIIWPGNYLISKFPEKIKSAFSPEYELMRKYYPSSEPSSFWIRSK